MQIKLTLQARLELSIQPPSLPDDLPDDLPTLRRLLCSLHGPTSPETLSLIQRVTDKIRTLEN